MTPKKGHIGPQMLSGLLGTNRVTSPADRQPLLVKGHIHKRRYVIRGEVLDLVDDDLPEDDKKRHLKRVEIKEKFEAVMMTLQADRKPGRVPRPNGDRPHSGAACSASWPRSFRCAMCHATT